MPSIRPTTSPVVAAPSSSKPTLAAAIDSAAKAADLALKKLDKNADGKLTEKELTPLMAALDNQAIAQQSGGTNLKEMRKAVSENERTMMLIAQAAVEVIGNRDTVPVKELSTALRGQLDKMVKDLTGTPRDFAGAIGKMAAAMLLPEAVFNAAMPKAAPTPAAPPRPAEDPAGWRSGGTTRPGPLTGTPSWRASSGPGNINNLSRMSNPRTIEATVTSFIGGGIEAACVSSKKPAFTASKTLELTGGNGVGRKVHVARDGSFLLEMTQGGKSKFSPVYEP